MEASETMETTATTSTGKIKITITTIHSSVKVNKIKISDRIKHHAQFLPTIFQQVAVFHNSHNTQKANPLEAKSQEAYALEAVQEPKSQEANANNAELIFL
jgi:hypothetical protein